MRDYRLKKESPWTPEARTTVWIGFALRLLMLIVILYVAGEFWDIYYIEDDKKYEDLAAVYRANAHGLFDIDLFDTLTVGYNSTFWPFVMCTTAKLFGSIYVGRFINVILSTICIVVTYNLCYEISGSQKAALTAARWFAFLPLSVLVACFPIKDILIMLGVMYAFYIFVRIQNNRKVEIHQFAILAVLLICVYLSRGAVTELLLMYLLAYYLQRLFRSKRYLVALMLLAGAVAVIVVFRNQILSSFMVKVDNYDHNAVSESAGLNAIRVTGVTDLYKLPLAYAFCMLQPLVLELFAPISDTRPWQTVMAFSNITIYPVAIGAWLYMFVKKHNLFFWLSSFAMFSAVIILSLGVSRHYLFLLPVHMINCSLYLDEGHENFKNRRTLVILGTFALFVLVFCYSLVKLF